MGKNRLGTQSKYKDYYQKGGSMAVFRGKRRGAGLFSSMVKGLFSKKNIQKVAQKAAKKIAPHAIKAGTKLLSKAMNQDEKKMTEQVNKAISLADALSSGQVKKILGQQGKGYSMSGYKKKKPKKTKKKVKSIFE